MDTLDSSVEAFDYTKPLRIRYSGKFSCRLCSIGTREEGRQREEDTQKGLIYLGSETLRRTHKLTGRWLNWMCCFKDVQKQG